MSANEVGQPDGHAQRQVCEQPWVTVRVKMTAMHHSHTNTKHHNQTQEIATLTIQIETGARTMAYVCTKLHAALTYALHISHAGLMGMMLHGTTCQLRSRTHQQQCIRAVCSLRCARCQLIAGSCVASGFVFGYVAAMQPTARSAWVARWSGLLAVAAHTAFAASLLELPLAGECNVGGEAPGLHEVLADVRWQLPANAPLSRLGPGRSIPTCASDRR